MEIRFTGNTVKEVMEQVKEFISGFFIPQEQLDAKLLELRDEIKADQDTLAQVPAEEPKAEEPKQEPIKPVLTQAQMQENLEKAPEHKGPPQPSFDDVRDALLKYRSAKGKDALGKLLAAYGVKNVKDLKPEDYLGIHDRALAEVG